MKPKISIITVCYNSEKSIRKTLESIKRQKYNNYEIIIVDGESKDNTLKIIKEYKVVFKNKLKIYSEKDNGIYDAMNKGIELANGEWIYFLNSDDWLNDEALIEVDKYLSENIDFLYGDVIRVLEYNYNIYKKLEKASDSLKKISQGMLFSHQSLFVKKDVFEKIDKFDLNFNIAADWDFICRMYKNDYRYLHINYPISYFQMGGTCSKSHIIQRHKVRKKNNLIGLADKYLIKEICYKAKNEFIRLVIKDYMIKKILINFEEVTEESQYGINKSNFFYY
ncbi:glycosyltransferase family 2 protein [Clostridium perfringens]|uniref:glycosyltransferase family 2 protein n=1 Tax=Clostridium perfringens TaxID=1502 RepID=UPI0029148020|nr:glycosyltransferase family 2 protein [Clostridium perfringens]